MAGITLTYETKSCGRCGGSGQYSYCQTYGTRCFQCRGKGTTLSAAGKKAHLAVEAFKVEHFSVLGSDIKVGDVINFSGYVRTVSAVEVSGSASIETKVVDGQTVQVRHPYLDITVTKPIPSAFGVYSTQGVFPTQSFVRGVSGADWQRVVDFARTIKKGVTIVEPAQVTA